MHYIFRIRLEKLIIISFPEDDAKQFNNCYILLDSSRLFYERLSRLKGKVYR